MAWFMGCAPLHPPVMKRRVVGQVAPILKYVQFGTYPPTNRYTSAVGGNGHGPTWICLPQQITKLVHGFSWIFKK